MHLRSKRSAAARTQWPKSRIDGPYGHIPAPPPAGGERPARAGDGGAAPGPHPALLPAAGSGREVTWPGACFSSASRATASCP
ncbi:hypothetical protein AB0J63_29475 [Streptosporangium canum]|uniref:hypothetical protein n=1 Tax=Streptosporangium canum TaxID=324952 RepID=UPI00343C0C20